MKKALTYALSLALVLALVLVACGKQQSDQPNEPDPTQAAASEPAQEPTAPEVPEQTPTDPEPMKQSQDDTPQEAPAEQTPAAPDETEASQPPEEMKPQESAPEEPKNTPQEQPETKPVQQNTSGTAQSKPTNQPQGGGDATTTTTERPAGFDDYMKQYMEDNGYTGGADHAMTEEEAAELRGLLNGTTGQAQADGASGSQDLIDWEQRNAELDEQLKELLGS